MKIILAAAALMSIACSALANDGSTSPPTLRQIVDELAARGFAIVQNGDKTIRLVRDGAQCASGEKLAPIWINFFDARQHLSGYTCQRDAD